MRAMQGLSPAVPMFERARLGAPMPANDRREDYVRGTLEIDGRDLVVRPYPVQDSSMLMTLAKADVLIRRESHAPPAIEGAEVDVIRLDGRSGYF